MTDSTRFDSISMFMAPLVQWVRENAVDHVFLQIGVIALAFLLASLFAKKVGQHLEKNVEKARAHMRFVLSPAHFVIVLKFVFLAGARMVLPGPFQTAQNTRRCASFGGHFRRRVAGHSLCIALHKKCVLVPLCVPDLPGCLIFAAI